MIIHNLSDLKSALRPTPPASATDHRTRPRTPPPPPPPRWRGRSRTGYLFALGASLALLHVVVNIALSLRSSSPLIFPSSSPWGGGSSSSSSSAAAAAAAATTSTNARRRWRPPNADEVVRRSHARTFGALRSMADIATCGPNVGIRACVRSMLDEVRKLSSEGSGNDATTTTAEEEEDGGGGGGKGGGASSSSSFPWWFVTMLRDAPVGATWHNLTIMSPPMDFCTIEKVATTQWRNVQCVLNEGKNVSKSPMPCQLKKDRLEARRRGVKGGSRGGRRTVSRAVMLRDPLERMLSGYLNKCAHVPTRKLEGHCEPNSVFNGTILTSGIRDDKRQLFAAYVDAFPLKWNIHFFPQSMYCDGLFRHVGEYDFVGYMGGDFYGELDRMTSTFKDGPGGGAFADAIEKVFRPSRGGEGGDGEEAVAVAVIGDKARRRSYDAARHPTNAPEYVREYFTAASVRRALEYFAVDYVSLGLEVPGWVHDVLAEDANAFG